MLDKIKLDKKKSVKVTACQNSDKLANYLYWFPIPIQLLFYKPRVVSRPRLSFINKQVTQSISEGDERELWYGDQVITKFLQILVETKIWYQVRRSLHYFSKLLSWIYYYCFVLSFVEKTVSGWIKLILLQCRCRN